MPTEEVFDLHHQFTLYMRRSKMNVERMPAVQLVELKRAFFGACGQMLLIMRDDVARFPPEKAIEICTDMLVQIGKFWEGEIQNLNQN